MSKLRVAVLRGGFSNEFEISLRTGGAVLTHIDTNHFEPVDVVISKGGEWLIDGRARLPEHILSTIDVVFIALHGVYGEDGTLQRLLDRFGVPYTGSRAYPSAVAMNKALAKGYLKDSHVKLPHHVTVTQESSTDLPRILENITKLFGPEYVIKPINSGSSVGTRMVKNQSDLSHALKHALEEYEEVMVEERIRGREVSCGVIERYRGEPLYALPPIEIIVPKGTDFFDLTVKYDGSTEEICPSTFDHSTKKEIESLAAFVHESLGLSQYSRSDFIVSPKGIYFLEVNTLPGLTPESLLPKEIQTIGGTYADFISHLIRDAHERRR